MNINMYISAPAISPVKINANIAIDEKIKNKNNRHVMRCKTAPLNVIIS